MPKGTQSGRHSAANEAQTLNALMLTSQNTQRQFRASAGSKVGREATKQGREDWTYILWLNFHNS